MGKVIHISKSENIYHYMQTIRCYLDVLDKHGYADKPYYKDLEARYYQAMEENSLRKLMYLSNLVCKELDALGL